MQVFGLFGGIEKRMNCILVGGSGFLGLNIAKGLLTAGYNVTIADIRPPAIPGFTGIIKDVKFYQADYRDSGSLKNILKDQEILFHLACSSLPSTSVCKTEDDIRENVLEPVRFFKEASKNGIRLIVFPSSGGTVYGNSEKLPIDETSLTDPICSYGVTKLMTEKYLSSLNKMSGVDYLIFRISNLYGPGQVPNAAQGIIANVISKLLSGKPVTVFGKGENVRDYVYVQDVVKAFILGIERGLKNDIFNIGTGKGHSIKDVIGIISRIMNVKPQFIYADKRPFDVEANVLDSGKFKSATGWEAETPIEDGINSAYRWVKESFYNG